jgi:predicted nucleic acid-binding Zn ribbon protein
MQKRCVVCGEKLVRRNKFCSRPCREWRIAEFWEERGANVLFSETGEITRIIFDVKNVH